MGDFLPTRWVTLQVNPTQSMTTRINLYFDVYLGQEMIETMD